MCGISGELNWKSCPSEQIVEAMSKAQSHRGPDAAGVKALGPIVIAHRRLSILDTSESANQPLSDQTGRYWLTYNGEIYNFKSLRRELQQMGKVFRTGSDTEVVVEAWSVWGVDCLQKFVGMFSFALWDNQEKELFLVRDRMGEKPLFYAYATPSDSESGIIFASELKALLRHPHIQRNISQTAVSQFLSYSYILSDQCIIKDVYKLPPAHYLHVKQGAQPKQRSYWNLSEFYLNKPNWNSESQATERFNELLEETIGGQTISDVPLGAFLSGGIDSSTVVRAMSQQGKAHNTKTYSIGFKERSFSEIEEGKLVSDFLGVDHHTQFVDADMAKSLPKIVYAMDEPFADTSMIPTYFLSQFARKNVTVSLSGDGGDELFAGYETYVADKMYRVASRFPNAMLNSMSWAADRFVPTSLSKVSFDYKLKQFLKGCSLPYDQAHCFWRTIFSESDKKRLYKSGKSPFSSFGEHFKEVSNCHPLDQALYVDTKTWLVDDILVKVDRTSMAHSLECRAPFLDHRIVQFAAGLPVEWKLRGFQKKYLLKKSQENKLPSEVLYKAKKGFSAPVGHWLKGDLKTLAQEVLSDSVLTSWCHKGELENLWRHHMGGKADNSYKIFGLMCLGLWLKEWKLSL